MENKHTTERPILLPEYMEKFACIGSNCEDTCCQGWRVDIDKKTLKKYKKTRDVNLKASFENNISRNRSSTSNNSYANIKMNKDSQCSFLTEEKLCNIQLRLGEDYLSNTCATYPRQINSINGVIEKSATMSCPEAVRLALLNPNKMEFKQFNKLKDKREFIGKNLNTTINDYSDSVQSYFWDLRIFSIKLLQDRAYALPERLIILGIFYKKIQQSVEEKNVHVIPKIIEAYEKKIANGGMKDSFDKIPTKIDIQMKICKELIQYRTNQTITSERYIECLNEMIKGLDLIEGVSLEEVNNHYKRAYNQYYQPFMDEHEYILENYLVNYVFKNLFPINQKTVFDDYVMLVVHFSLIKLHLIGMAGYHKELNIELTTKLIQSFAKTIEHSSQYLVSVLNIFKENHMDTMAYMAILVKN